MDRATRRTLERLVAAAGSLLPGPGRRRAGKPSDRVMQPWRQDAGRAYPAAGLTPARMRAFLQAADAGQPALQFELFSEMLQRWARLAAVEKTRRLALTGLPWELTPASGDDGGIARHCRQTLERLERFDETLDTLSAAIGFGVAAAELVWDRGQLVDLTPVPHTRLFADPDEPWRLRVRTEQEPTLGVALDEQPFKWAIHAPRGTPGRPFEGGLLRASCLLYLAQSFSLRDWMIFSQVGGMPVRIAQYEPGTPEEDKQKLLRMMQDLASDAVAVISKGVELKLIEPARGERPYQPIQDYCNTEITILWLGQHLTTDIRSSGSRAAAEVHDRVREDLLVNDIADEARTLRRDLLTPIVRARFGDAAPVPHFRRSLAAAVDTKVLAEVLATAVNGIGLEVPRAWAHKTLGIPQPREGESVLVAPGRARRVSKVA